MGRLIPENQNLRQTSLNENPVQMIVESNVQRLIENSSGAFSVHIEGAPSFVTYYHREIDKSTEDRGLENVEKDLGHHSPIKYSKIYNFALFGIGQLSADLNTSEGLEISSYGGEAIILPKTIEPLPGDYFSFSFIGKEYLFRIDDVVFDQIKANPMYRVNYSLNRKMIEEDFKESISGEFDFLYKNVGTSDKPIISRRANLTITLAYDIYEELIKKYIKYYYDPKLNCFILKMSGMNIYNPYLTKFVIDNNLIKFRREFYNSYYFEEILPRNVEFFENYNKSPYFLLDIRDSRIASKITKNKMIFSIISLIENPFYVNGETCYEVFVANNDDEDGITIWSQELLDHIASNTPFNRSLTKYSIDNMFIDHLNGKDILEDVTNLQTINCKDWLPDIYSYINIPFILKMLKDSIDSDLKRWNVEF